MEETLKLTEDQLKEIQALNNKFMSLKIGIADAEIQKKKLLSELSELQGQFKAMEDALIEEYGQDAVIDLKTGDVKPSKDKDGKNK
tara:strand:- start:37 stop:294 length:258 start_codon:yes stop_codon:yes gene_type:complete